ncbi:hypothetical protein BVRB_9g210210 [Beta vulgaris subsp. vulgaris]|nr:hypothetical protein BVRB_9g210210 [Beta vulgaris subsp. vulgaris]
MFYPFVFAIVFLVLPWFDNMFFAGTANTRIRILG